jgi:ribosomal-protein-alanine N-acetyltransferase
MPNVASAGVLEKDGMRLEGVLREHMFAKGAFRDLRLYPLLRREWAPPTEPPSVYHPAP